MTHTIQLDIAAGCPFEEIIKDTLQFDIAAKLITLIGPTEHLKTYFSSVRPTTSPKNTSNQ